MAIRTGTSVKWTWGSAWAEGTTALELRSEVERA